jgi:hypothetical protein
LNSVSQERFQDPLSPFAENGHKFPGDLDRIFVLFMVVFSVLRMVPTLSFHDNEGWISQGDLDLPLAFLPDQISWRLASHLCRRKRRHLVGKSWKACALISPKSKRIKGLPSFSYWIRGSRA